jgi:hypothetical protein
MLKALVVTQFWWDTVTRSFRHYMHSYQPGVILLCQVRRESDGLIGVFRPVNGYENGLNGFVRLTPIRLNL